MIELARKRLFPPDACPVGKRWLADYGRKARNQARSIVFYWTSNTLGVVYFFFRMQPVISQSSFISSRESDLFNCGALN
jgi:hypothetical protein